MNQDHGGVQDPQKLGGKVKLQDSQSPMNPTNYKLKRETKVRKDIFPG